MEKKFISYEEATKDLKLIRCDFIEDHFKLIDHSYRASDYVDDELIKRINDDDSYNDDIEREEALVEKAEELYWSDLTYKYYLTDASTSDVERLTSAYGLQFAYCDELDIWVLLVNHDYDESRWDGVILEVYPKTKI